MSIDDGRGGIETLPASAAEVFGPHLPTAVEYARLLATEGVRRGVIGPRESERIWSRHLLNCAVLSDLVRTDVRVVDVGSGAGLPGVPLALARPDLRVDLVEPLLRRVTFLSDVIGSLDLGDRVRVVRGRTDELAVRQQVGNASVVTARAVAPLDRLVKWCLPLMDDHGDLLALKGASAQSELDEHRRSLRSWGAHGDVVQCGVGTLREPTTVVRIRIDRAARPRKGVR